MNDIYIIMCRETETYYKRIDKMAYMWVKEPSQASHYNAPDMFVLTTDLTLLGCSVVGRVDAPEGRVSYEDN